MVARKDDLLASAVLGAVANLPWEMAHSLLYRSVSEFTWQQHLLCCGGAALLDGAGIAVIFGTGAVVFREPRWTRHRSPARFGFAVLLGVAGAAATELVALRLGWWNYEHVMPVIPGTKLGISPVVQFMMLPLAVLFWALPCRWKHLDEKSG